MLVKANVLLYLDTADGDHEERASAIGLALENGLSGVVNNSGFPEGEVITGFSSGRAERNTSERCCKVIKLGAAYRSRMRLYVPGVERRGASFRRPRARIRTPGHPLSARWDPLDSRIHDVETILPVSDEEAEEKGLVE